MKTITYWFEKFKHLSLHSRISSSVASYVLGREKIEKFWFKKDYLPFTPKKYRKKLTYNEALKFVHYLAYQIPRKYFKYSTVNRKEFTEFATTLFKELPLGDEIIDYIAVVAFTLTLARYFNTDLLVKSRLNELSEILPEDVNENILRSKDYKIFVAVKILHSNRITRKQFEFVEKTILPPQKSERQKILSKIVSYLFKDPKFAKYFSVVGDFNEWDTFLESLKKSYEIYLQYPEITLLPSKDTIKNEEELLNFVSTFLHQIFSKIKKIYNCLNPKIIDFIAKAFIEEYPLIGIKGEDVKLILLDSLPQLKRKVDAMLNEIKLKNEAKLREIEKALNSKSKLPNYHPLDFETVVRQALREFVKISAPIPVEMIPSEELEVKVNYAIDSFLETLDPSKLSIEIKPFNTYCPICKTFVEGSEYLYNRAFPNDYYAYWIANLVKHYRHEHIRYYDLSWKYWWYGEKNPEYANRTHEEFKIIVNNRAKRQLIRAILKDENLPQQCKENLIKAVLKLQHNDEKTIKTVELGLEKLKNRPKRGKCSKR